MLQIEHMDKGYPERPLFVDFSATFEHGRYWLQGPNGSGKSTLLRCIAGLEAANRGRMLWQGEQLTPAIMRAQIGISADAIEFPPFLSFAAILRYWQHSYVDAHVDALVAGFALQNVQSQTWQHASVGQRKKLSLLLALSRPVPIVLLDEPFNGLDDAACEFLTTILSTHTADLTMVVSHQHHPLFDTMTPLQLSSSGLCTPSFAG